MLITDVTSLKLLCKCFIVWYSFLIFTVTVIVSTTIAWKQYNTCSYLLLGIITKTSFWKTYVVYYLVFLINKCGDPLALRYLMPFNLKIHLCAHTSKYKLPRLVFWFAFRYLISVFIFVSNHQSDRRMDDATRMDVHTVNRIQSKNLMAMGDGISPVQSSNSNWLQRST